MSQWQLTKSAWSLFKMFLFFCYQTLIAYNCGYIIKQLHSTPARDVYHLSDIVDLRRLVITDGKVKGQSIRWNASDILESTINGIGSVHLAAKNSRVCWLTRPSGLTWQMVNASLVPRLPLPLTRCFARFYDVAEWPLLSTSMTTILEASCNVTMLLAAI